jgi:hypothetical protein
MKVGSGQENNRNNRGAWLIIAHFLNQADTFLSPGI